MDNSANAFSAPGTGHWSFTQEAERLARPTILVIEDDQDIRDMLATLLEIAGFVPVACDNAEQGLNALREGSFDLILTDYALPKHSGLWLLQNAEAEGLINGTPVLIVTAYPHVSGAAEYEVVHKPFDLDDLVERVRRRLESTTPRRRAVTSRPVVPAKISQSDGNHSECPEPVELILYVSAHSPRSAATVRDIKKVLARFPTSQVRLTVCDLSTNPDAGVEDGVAFTPTLVRRAPGPRTFILGHLTNPDLLLEILGDCNLEES